MRIVHDWLVAPGGAEKVLEQIIECFPNADIFTLVDFLEDRTCRQGPAGHDLIHTEAAVREASATGAILPLMPLAIEQLDLSGYDLVIRVPMRSRRACSRARPDACQLRAFADALRVGPAASVPQGVGLATGFKSCSRACCCITFAAGIRVRRTASIT